MCKINKWRFPRKENWDFFLDPNISFYTTDLVLEGLLCEVGNNLKRKQQIFISTKISIQWLLASNVSITDFGECLVHEIAGVKIFMGIGLRPLSINLISVDCGPHNLMGVCYNALCVITLLIKKWCSEKTILQLKCHQ